MTCRLNLSRQVSVQDFLSTTHTTHRTLHATLGISELFGRGSRFYFFSPNNVETSPVKTENKKKLQNEWKHWEHFSRNSECRRRIGRSNPVGFLKKCFQCFHPSRLPSVIYSFFLFLLNNNS